jgi:hypothetical protein
MVARAVMRGARYREYRQQGSVRCDGEVMKKTWKLTGRQGRRTMTMV